MELKQNDRERILDALQKGEITVDQGNVQMVLMRRVMLCVSKAPASVRRALNAAVKSGELGHMKKDGHKPEAYFHPTFDYLAKAERAKHADTVMRAVAGVRAGSTPSLPL